MSEQSSSGNRSQGYRWHAAIARDLAAHCQSAAARAALQDMARRYERLAAFAERDRMAAGSDLPRLASGTFRPVHRARREATHAAE